MWTVNVPVKNFKNIPSSAFFLSTIGMFLSSIGNSFAQEPYRPETDIGQFIQEIFPVATDDVDYAELYEALFQLYTHPANLNTITRDELAALYILSEEQLSSFFDYRTKHGPLLSLYELQAVPTFDVATIRKLLPFVSVESARLSLRDSFKNPTQHFLLFRTDRPLEKQKGFSASDSTSSSRYAGDPWQWYMRYRYARTGQYSVGFTLEKDAGEIMSWQPKRQVFGVDFSSFHVQIQHRGRLKNLILGDYQMQAGQGTILSAGFSLGKGAEVIRTTYRSSLGLRPFTSVMEAGFFRGIAATIALHKTIDVTGFFSSVRRDASVADTPEGEPLTVTSLSIAGLHRTPTERANQAIIPERNIGFHALYRAPSNRGQLGVTLLHTTYGAFVKRKDVLYNYFEFKGSKNLIAGINGDYRWKNVHLFGEAARSQSGGLGGVAGLILPVTRSVDFTMLYRNYARNFHSFYGNPFGEATRPGNESGIYQALRYAPTKQWQFSGFYDRFRFPWLKYLVDKPSNGVDYFVHVQYTPSKRAKWYVLFHEERKEKNAPASGQTVTPVVPTTRRIALINFDYNQPLKYSLRSRIQAGDFTYRGLSRSQGIIFVQDITWRWPKWEVSGRLALYLTDNYDSRQYVYEKDALYAFSVPAYYDKGTRHYLMIRRTFGKHLKVWLRWAQYRYFNLETISSGLNEIQGKTKSELKMQLMYGF